MIDRPIHLNFIRASGSEQYGLTQIDRQPSFYDLPGPIYILLYLINDAFISDDDINMFIVGFHGRHGNDLIFKY